MTTPHNFNHHFVKTNAILATAVLEANGWNAQVLAQELLVGPQSFVYVWDQESNWLWMCSIQKEDFISLSKSASNESDKRKGQIQRTACQFIGMAASGSAQKDNEDWQSMLGCAAVAYSGTTKTWELANKMRDCGHFVVIRYPNKQTGYATLRPFYVGPNGKNTALDALELKDILDQVRAADRQHHPEWFN